MERSMLATSLLRPLGLTLAVVLMAGGAWGLTPWTKYEGNPVLVRGEPGEWDAGVVDHSEVLFDGVTFHMWYAGGLASHEADIGYATSTDGVHWDKWPGNPVLVRGEPGEWDAGSLQPGAVLWDGALYHMWYGAGAVPGGAGDWFNGYATSPDGVHWTKYAGNPLPLAGEPGNWDSGGGLITAAVLAEGVGFRAWYWGGVDPDSSIGYATSPDGVTWTTRPDPVLWPPVSGWDRNVVAFPMVTLEGDAYHMWYTGGPDACGGIGHAESADGITWIRQPPWEPVLPRGREIADWDALCVFSPRVVLAGDTAHMWYNGISSMGVFAIGHATAPLPFRDARESFIPAAAVAAGAEGAFFQTDVEVNNKGTEEAQISLQWLPRGENNSEPIQSEPITLPAGHSVRYENVLNEVFGLEPDSIGALKLVASTSSVIGMSRTYNIPAGKAAGTYGQAMPAIAPDDFIRYGEQRRILFASENNEMRTNVGCVNGTDSTMVIRLEAFDTDGSALATEMMILQARSNDQLNRLFEDYQPMNGYVDVWTPLQDGSFYCYGSLVDNITSDPTTLPPQVPSDDTIYIPAAALAAGAEGSFFTTDLDLANVGPTALTYELLWLPRGADNSDPVRSETFSLAAGSGVRYSNVLGEVFGLEPDQVGALAVEASGIDLLAMSRTYNLDPTGSGGTFGQELPGIPANQMIPTGVTKRILFLSENDDARSNVGCINGVVTEVAVAIDLFDSDGAKLETRYMMLPPYSNRQINGIFQGYAPVNGYVDVRTSTPDATIYCYGSVLDNTTSDPTTVPPQ